MNEILNGRYELEQRIGDGGMAVVYRGRDRVLGRAVAIKILRDQYVADAAFLGRFRREAQSAAALSHPNIVNIYDVGEDNGLHYIVMEYVPGRNLKEVIRAEAPMSARAVVDLGRQLCAALDYAHAQGLIHRDIKPQNIMVTPAGLVKVADFGIAKGAQDAHLTQTGIAMGTVHYAAPEQIEGHDATPASDIYATGVVLYEMLTGRLPFEGETPVSIALKHINEAPLRLRTYNPQAPAGLEAIVLTALNKDPADRFPSAEALGQALVDYQYYSSPRSVLSGASGAGAATVPVQRVAAGSRPITGRAALDSRSNALPGAATARRRQAAARRDDIGCLTWMAGLIGIALLVGLLLVAFNVLPRMLGEREQPPPTSQPTSATTPGAQNPDGAGVVATPQPAGSPTRLPAVVGTPTPTPTATATATPTVTPTVTPTATATPVPRMPDLRGHTLEEAQHLLAPFGVEQIEFQPPGQFNDQYLAGQIIEQSPPAGAGVQPGSAVRVVVSRGPAAIVPNVVNQEVSLASRLLADRNLQVKTVEEASRAVQEGHVIRSDPAAGAQISANSTVTLVVSVGDKVQVPDIFGKPMQVAAAELEAAGFRVGNIAEQTRDQVPESQRAAFDQVSPGAVLSADPNYGTWAPRGTIVTIAIRKP